MSRQLLEVADRLVDVYGMTYSEIGLYLNKPNNHFSLVRYSLTHPERRKHYARSTLQDDTQKLLVLEEEYKSGASLPKKVAIDPETFHDFLTYLKTLSGLSFSAIAKRASIPGPKVFHETSHLLRSSITSLENLWAELEAEAFEIQQSTRERAQDVLTPLPNAKLEYARKLRAHVDEIAQWNFPDLWLWNLYDEGTTLCQNAIEASFIPKILSKFGGNLTQAARACQLDRKHFRVLLRKHQGTDEVFEFSDEDLLRPYADVKGDVMSDFRMQLLVRAFEEAQGNISRAADIVRMDRKHFRECLIKIPGYLEFDTSKDGDGNDLDEKLE